MPEDEGEMWRRCEGEGASVDNLTQHCFRAYCTKLGLAADADQRFEDAETCLSRKRTSGHRVWLNLACRCQRRQRPCAIDSSHARIARLCRLFRLDKISLIVPFFIDFIEKCIVVPE